MCVAAIGCFGGLAAIIHGVEKEEDAIIPGVVVAGLALAVLLRIISQLITAARSSCNVGLVTSSDDNGVRKELKAGALAWMRGRL